MTRQVFIRAGTRRMTFQNMPDADARHAEKEGWGQIADDPRTNADSYSESLEPEHVEKANAYFHEQQQGYRNREMTTAQSPAERSLPLGEPDGGEDTIASPMTGKTSPLKGKKSATNK
ncbi:MAG TPA: hypothetical protein VK602_02080 [Phyllobacterium sp.]|nr:hypothetical protein [Phyllobacterium sp.]